MPTDYQALVPRVIAQQVLQALYERSVALALGNRMPIGSGQASIPVVSFLPVAGFVNPTYGGRKPATKIEWSAQQIVAEEIACVLAVPTAFIDDAGVPIWDSVRPAMAAAIARTFDDAVLFGTAAPASYPTGGLAGIAGAPQTGATMPEAIDAAAGVVEASGATVNGIVGGPNVHTALRAAWANVMASPDQSPTQNLYGWPVEVTTIWDSTHGDAVVGDWQYLLIGVREDITFSVSTEAPIYDNAGALVANTWQDNLTAMKCWARLGVAVGQPLNADSVAISPFEFADWTGP